ncbi:hypothetical protein [Psychroserpens sp.]|uniref:hypothetical protein n=2 Tax=Psychroserpens sp. TaxID=2020870 RepID=UPI003C76EAF4
MQKTLSFEYSQIHLHIDYFFINMPNNYYKYTFMGRPPTRPIKFRDGFYIEIRNKGKNTGIKLHRDTKEQMMRTVKEYEQTKDVIILGESINGKWVNKTPIHHVPGS